MPASSRKIGLIYVVPTHNDGALIETTADVLIGHLSTSPAVGPSSVVLVENGSRDDTAARAKSLEGSRSGVQVRALSLQDAGIGFAYHEGMLAGLEIAKANQMDLSSTWLVLTASDLPFGFSDLESFLVARKLNADIPIAIGSKAHPMSSRRSGIVRNAATLTYRLARRMLIGMRTGDSQGSFFLRADFVTNYLARIRARDYFYTTELVHLVEADGHLPLELAVQLVPETRASTVKPIADGRRMLKSLLALRRRRAGA